jgi:hypothetical protein
VTTDVTALFENYRECARHLRNTFFSTRETKDWDTVDDFTAVARVLFERLVLYRLQQNYSRMLDTAVHDHRLLIVPAAERMPLMISREKHGGGYWDHPVQHLARGDARIAFLAYFDWDEHSLIDFRYYHGVILESETHPELADHQVFIETIYGRVHFDPTNVA